MRNTLQDLNNTLFEQLERLMDDETLENPDAFEREMKRSQAVTSVAAQIIQSGEISLKAAKLAQDFGVEDVRPILGLTVKEEQ